MIVTASIMQTQNQKTHSDIVKIAILIIISLGLLLGCLWSIQDRFEELERQVREVDSRVLKLETETK